MKRYITCLFAGCAAILLAAEAGAYTVSLNWDTVADPGTAWNFTTTSGTSGTASRSWDFDSTHAGNDVKITIDYYNASGNSSPFTGGDPQISAGAQGGLPTVENTLALHVNWSSKASFIRVKVEFLYTGGINNAHFNLFDVDSSAGNWQDQLRNISATNGPSLFAADLTNSAFNTIANDNLLTATATAIPPTNTSPGTGAGSGNGNVGIAFSQAGIASFTFDYGNGPDLTGSNPSSQWIALHDITFDVPAPVPEPSPLWGAAFCGGLLSLRRRGWRRS